MWSQVGPQPIQIAEVNALLDAMGIEGSFTKMKYIRLVQLMDRVELKHHADILKADRAKSKN